MRSMVGLLTLAGDLRSKEMFVAKQRLTSSSPPLGNNTNPDDKLEFVLFFSNEYFGIKVDLDGKKKNQPGV